MRGIMTRGIKISIETRAKILARLNAGESSIDLAKQYGLTKQTIERIARRFSPIAPKVLTSTAQSISAASSVDFIELGLPDIPAISTVEAKRLEIAVKSDAISITIDGIIAKDQLNLIFKLIEGLC